ncbi:hypothetical protein EDC01DRAFT_703638 [Geopyxis carbonaria]|nr:hypothetical protein EDC01DRAFT_703638 [Geopyxis carbonaria]
MAPLRTLARLLPRTHVRLASSSASTPPKARLAKPTKFTPPSHPSRRPAGPIYHGPTHTPDETKHYPHTLPPPNTWAHWFLTNRRLHFYLSLGILASLASVVSVTNFLATNPHAASVFWRWNDPVGSVRSLLLAWRDSTEAESARVKAMRRKMVEDVEKRGEYRKAHGLETEESGEGALGGWRLRRGMEDPKVRANAMMEEAKRVGAGEAAVPADGWVEEELRRAEAEAVRDVPVVVEAEGVAENGKPAPKKSWWRWF